jgi:hypothetical protein
MHISNIGYKILLTNSKDKKKVNKKRKTEITSSVSLVKVVVGFLLGHGLLPSRPRRGSTARVNPRITIPNFSLQPA